MDLHPRSIPLLNGSGTRWGLDLNKDRQDRRLETNLARRRSPRRSSRRRGARLHRLNAVLITEAELPSAGRCRPPKPSASARRGRRPRPGSRHHRQAAGAERQGAVGAARERRAAVRPGRRAGRHARFGALPDRAILFENNKQHDWIQTGEMIQIAPTCGGWWTARLRATRPRRSSPKRPPATRNSRSCSKRWPRSTRRRRRPNRPRTRP